MYFGIDGIDESDVRETIDEQITKFIDEAYYTKMLKDRFHPFMVECEFQYNKYLFLVLNYFFVYY